jgi:hypothetical protein
MRSYTNHHDLGQHLASIAPRADWQAIRPLFDRRTGDPFDVPSDIAAAMGRAFKAIAPLANPTWQTACLELGNAAAEAARNNAVWHWS